VIPISIIIIIVENHVKNKAFPPSKYARMAASDAVPMLGIVHDPRMRNPVTVAEPVATTTLKAPLIAPPNLTVRRLTAILNYR